MHLTIHTTDGGQLDIDDFDKPSLLDLLDDWPNERTTLLTFALNDGMAYIPKAAVARIDAID